MGVQADRGRPITMAMNSSRYLLWTAAALVLLLFGRGLAKSSVGHASAVPDQSRGGVQALAAGKFLVASRDLQDPNFAETVVLLLAYEEAGAMGLVLNRRSKVPLSRLLKELPEAKDRSDPVYLGGPVARTVATALLRSQAKPQDSRHVFGDVYMIHTRAQLQKSLSEHAGATALRVYLGQAGWAAGQLEKEVELGVWHILRADAATVFHPDPDSVWPRMMRNLEVRYAWQLDAFSRWPAH